MAKVTSNTDKASAGVVLVVALVVIVIVMTFVILSTPIELLNPHKSDYQRGWDAAALAYRGDYARGVTDGQHKALVAHCTGSLEAPSE